MYASLCYVLNSLILPNIIFGEKSQFVRLDTTSVRNRTLSFPLFAISTKGRNLLSKRLKSVCDLVFDIWNFCFLIKKQIPS